MSRVSSDLRRVGRRWWRLWVGSAPFSTGSGGFWRVIGIGTGEVVAWGEVVRITSVCRARKADPLRADGLTVRQTTGSPAACNFRLAACAPARNHHSKARQRSALTLVATDQNDRPVETLSLPTSPCSKTGSRSRVELRTAAESAPAHRDRDRLSDSTRNPGHGANALGNFCKT